jgi:hypothetical protein
MCERRGRAFGQTVIASRTAVLVRRKSIEARNVPIARQNDSLAAVGQQSFSFVGKQIPTVPGEIYC